MNTNDLPPAARLAALIEAGRAAHPEMWQCRFRRISLDGRAACALGFAQLGDGFPANDEAIHGTRGFQWLGMWPGALRTAIANANNNGATLDEICASLREGELAKVAA